MDEETPIPFKQYFPNLSLGAYFWLIILVSLIFFSGLGYFVGIRVSELPSFAVTPTPAYTQQAQSQVTSNPYDDNDADYSVINGYFVDNTNLYDQFIIRITALPNGIVPYIDSDYRTFDEPHVDIQYPYVFSRLNPLETYVVSASACYSNKKTLALVCAKNIKITTCSGSLQGDTCVIKGNGNEMQSSGEVDFLIPGATESANK